MFLTRSLFGRFCPMRKVPGSLWAGKQRRIPRLSESRKSAFMDELLLSERNHAYLMRPCISAEVEASTLAKYKARELQEEDDIFYQIHANKFHRRFVTRPLSSFWVNLEKSRRFNV